MAFNLNKNERADPSTKFDLSKANSPAAVAPQDKKNRSKTGVFALLGLLAIGAGAWFFLSRSSASSDKENAVIATTTVNRDSANVPGMVQNDAAVTTADTLKQAPTVTAEASNAPAATSSNAATDAGNGNNNPGRTSAAGFNNSVPATFAKGSTSISNLDLQLVNDLIAFLQKNPAAVIHVNGYASSEGELAINQQISLSRADAFKSYLVSKGISANRIAAAGKGIENPIGSNDSEEGRMKNRRIEVSIQ